METRANFILIGAFTLLAILGSLGFFIWLARVEIDRQYSTYGILFEDVSGLDSSGEVFFNGISVGNVIGLRIYEDDPSKVFATVQIDASTPIRTNTVAQLQSQGVTGVAFISLSGGAPGAPALAAADGALPIIASRRSTVQALVEDAPDLLIEATQLLKQFQELTGPENQSYVRNILRNLDASSERLDQALTDFSSVTTSVSDATDQISRFTDRLEPIGAALESALGAAEDTMETVSQTFNTADDMLRASETAMQTIDATFAEAETLLRDQVPPLLGDLSTGVRVATETVADLGGRAARTLDGFSGTAELLNARLIELETAMQDASAAFDAVIEASDSFDSLVDGDGVRLVAEAREVLSDAKVAIAAIETTVLQDVPPVVADIRRAVATASDAVDRVAGDLTGLTGRFDPLAQEAESALASASSLFERARDSLGAVDTTLASADATLGAARMAFEATTGVIDTDLGPVLSDIRTASDRISVAVENVTREVPAITADLRALIRRADQVVGQIQDTVAASAPGIGQFTRTGLPELTRFSVEARNLVNSLNTLARRIERDPARFFLNDRVPEYRR